MGVMDKSGTVYGLIDPECKELFYVGCTSQTPAKRLHGHVSAKAGTYSGNGARVKAYLACIDVATSLKWSSLSIRPTQHNRGILESGTVHGWYGSNLAMESTSVRAGLQGLLWFL